jgi:hypothetical protein
VAGSVVGEIIWARLLRRPGAANGLLITELTLFLLVLAGWLAAGSHPAGISALALLALVSVALGGQSIWALRIHQTTTYFTGMMTETINTAVSANAGVGTSLRQLGALLHRHGGHLRELRSLPDLPDLPAFPRLGAGSTGRRQRSRVMLLGRPGDAVTAGITTAVVMVVAAVSPQHAWQQPILRLADTVVGVAVGAMAAWTGIRVRRFLPA